MVLLNTPREMLEQRGASCSVAAPKRVVNVSPDEGTRHRKVSVTADDLGSPILRRKFDYLMALGVVRMSRDHGHSASDHPKRPEGKYTKQAEGLIVLTMGVRGRRKVVIWKLLKVDSNP